MDAAAARRFAEEWVAAWNARDLDRVLSHYAENFEMTSPYIASIAGEASGSLKGKASVRAYWQTALERLPDLHFELLEVFCGVESVTIRYVSANGRPAAEVFFFNEDGKVGKAVAHYG